MYAGIVNEDGDNQERGSIMECGSTGEFRMRDYVHAFEKSLNYLAGAILAIFAAGISYISTVPDWYMDLGEIVQNIHDDPKIFLCVCTAVLSTLPYYFYYTLKDNDNWNACQGKRDKWGLGKICILYEICMMSFFYLLVQGDLHFAGAKCIISFISALLSCLYLGLMIKGHRRGERIGYFVVVILSAIAFFILLFVNSLWNLKNNCDDQNYSVVCLLIMFILNAAVNLFFLDRSESNEEMGIISNRKKIMIPIISISIYTVSVVFCFYYFNEKIWVMPAVALLITLYEAVISCIKWEDHYKKVGACIVAFVIFVISIPIFVWRNKEYPDELALNWFMLIGISIYLAAIKYWGYLLKWLVFSKEQKRTKSKAMNTMVWFRNSILGSMLFTLVILLSGKSCYVLLVIMLICSLTAEIFLAHYVFAEQINHADKIYSKGRFIELLAIIMPVSFFILEKTTGFGSEWEIKMDVEIPQGMVFAGALLCCLLLLMHIRRKWKANDGIVEEEADVQETDLLAIDTGKLVGKLFAGIKRINFLLGQTMAGKNVGNFSTLTVSWCVYIVLTAAVLDFLPAFSNVRMAGAVATVFIVIVDWFVLSERLTDYYIEKMKAGKCVMHFKSIFKKIWDEYLEETLKTYKEKNAVQFQVGSRLRPILFYMGSSYSPEITLGDAEYSNIARAACSLELIHKASVMFDDFIDGDEMRHGEQAFHMQYHDINKMLLLGNAMLAYAQVNFANCRAFFQCSEEIMLRNMKKLSEIVTKLCEGCYKELSRADYERQDRYEIDEIIQYETVSLIEGSIVLGYSCFHREQGTDDYVNIEKLGKKFGYIFQYLNDLEPFSQKAKYRKHKGGLNHYDHGKKNIALVTLYHCASEDDKTILKENSYERTEQLYRKYSIEQTVLEYVRTEIGELNNILAKLEPGNQEWVKTFKELFNAALKEKGWEDKIMPL